MASITDTINILKHLSVQRITNLVRLKLSYIYSKWTKQARHRGMPFSLSIEPTTACNLGCPECPSGHRLRRGVAGTHHEGLTRATHFGGARAVEAELRVCVCVTVSQRQFANKRTVLFAN